MKYLKRFVAVVAVIVFCVTTAALITARAVEYKPIPLCGHEANIEVLVDEYRYEWEDGSHEFEMTYYDGERWIENAKIQCIIKKIYQVYRCTCACGENVEYKTKDSYEHTEPNCPEY